MRHTGRVVTKSDSKEAGIMSCHFLASHQAVTLYLCSKGGVTQVLYPCRRFCIPEKPTLSP